jgi:transcriptional regulator with XRE-family HTH domain
METIGDRLRHARKDIAGLSLGQVEAYEGLLPSHLSEMEKGKKNPTTETIRRLASRYAVSADYLLGLTDDPTQAADRREWAPIVIEMANNLMELPPYRQEEMARAIGGMVARHRAETNLDTMHRMLTALVGAESADVFFQRLDGGDSPDALLGLFQTALDQQRQQASDALGKDDLTLDR